MTDREKIISNDYYDLITDYFLPGGVEQYRENGVFQPITGELGIAYIDRADIMPMSISSFNYPRIPKLYGLMQTPEAMNFDPTPLIRSGITRVQRDGLSLTGKGVVIGFLDTGERVIVLSG